jgi:hypothetical protein
MVYFLGKNAGETPALQVNVEFWGNGMMVRLMAGGEIDTLGCGGHTCLFLRIIETNCSITKQ